MHALPLFVWLCSTILFSLSLILLWFTRFTVWFSDFCCLFPFFLSLFICGLSSSLDQTVMANTLWCLNPARWVEFSRLRQLTQCKLTITDQRHCAAPQVTQFWFFFPSKLTHIWCFPLSDPETGDLYMTWICHHLLETCVVMLAQQQLS